MSAPDRLTAVEAARAWLEDLRERNLRCIAAGLPLPLDRLIREAEDKVAAAEIAAGEVAA